MTKPEDEVVLVEDAYYIVRNGIIIDIEKSDKAVVKFIDEDAEPDYRFMVYTVIDYLTIGETNKGFKDLFQPVWGARTNWLNQRDYGWLDLRDAPANDPEYAEYTRLREKFTKELVGE